MTTSRLSKSPFMHPWFCAFMDMGPIMAPKLDWVIIFMSFHIRSIPNYLKKLEEVKPKLKQLTLNKFDFVDEQLFEDLFRYTLKELTWYMEIEADFPGLNNNFKIQFDDKIVVSDCLIPNSLKNELKFQSIKLRNLFKDSLDYQPNTNNKVVHLVHPSLYPFQYNKSPIILFNNQKGSYEVTLKPYCDKISNFKLGVSKHLYKKNFQWLPSLFNYDLSTNRYRLVSYVNNLHPTLFKPLYNILESIFNLALPGLELVLSRYQSDPITRVVVPDPFNAYNESFKSQLGDYNSISDDNERSKILDDLIRQKPRNIKPVKIDYVPYKTNYIDLKSKFPSLKIIPKLTNIELTPENPKYNGGSWHVDGTINEDIVATIVYYYDSENISDSKISFRATYDEPFYDDGDAFYVKEFYGIEHGEILNREIGKVDCNENRLLIFPNIFQHRIEPFELHDKSRSGHRKMMCLYVVDPYNDLVVTTNQVPPQQKSWYDDNSLAHLFSPKLRQKILTVTDSWPESMEKSKHIRDLILKERSTIDDSDASESEDEDDLLSPFQRSFSLND